MRNSQVGVCGGLRDLEVVGGQWAIGGDKGLWVFGWVVLFD